uniref:Uncharacterized protein n=1 Tax=Chromera velia CCMP2878 TaxID=1169474 RepID=A0A0G4H8V5_9ALVE|eukprot:Cvel_5912.t1-p1 / transcript=Cvel_5912.t1 / gene=Cvel_5912 / organism=Chromera_velia_CCMP2878 / gene_product=Probable ATP-dependent RNA helicase DDX60, putative / transcript_product=Probable ATP-dependent RNA helicase DDX60, putative / location=Cvel_scaffold282:43027-55889(+) / protein_length=2097 / sequence_SO=supercontig / SO=protein_coding / is_pseudo=false
MGDEYTGDDIELGGGNEDLDFDVEERSVMGEDELEVHLAKMEIPLEETEKPASYLRKWYSRLPAKQCDLLASLGAANLFFVHGEGLLVYLLGKEFIPFEDDIQFLVVVYHFERILRDMRDAGALNFRLVFFDFLQHEMDQYGASVWLLRNALIAHCRTVGIDVAVFGSWYSSEFKQYLREWEPSFVLLGDENMLRKDDEMAAVVPLSLMHTALCQGISIALFRQMAVVGRKFLAHAILPDALLCNDVYDSRIRSRVSALIKRPDLRVASKEGEEGAGGEEEDEVFGGATENKGEALASLRSFSSRGGGSVRSWLITEGLRRLVGRLEASEGLCAKHEGMVHAALLMAKFCVLHDALLDGVSLQQRCMAAPDMAATRGWSFYSQCVEGFLEELFKEEAVLLGQLLSDTSDLPASELESEAFSLKAALRTCGDLFDGRLFRTSLLLMLKQGGQDEGGAWRVEAGFFALPDEVKAHGEAAWKQVVPAENLKALRSKVGGGDGKEWGSYESLLPLDMSPVVKASVLSREGAPEMPPPPVKPAKPVVRDADSIFDSFFKEVLAGIDVDKTDDDAPQEEAEEGEGQSKGGLMADWKPPPVENLMGELRLEQTGFIDPIKDLMEASTERNEEWPKWVIKKMANMPEFKKTQFLARMRRNREQKGRSALHEYAKSLTGSDKLHHPIVVRGTKEAELKLAEADKDKQQVEKDKAGASKLSAKAREIQEKNKIEQNQKMKEADAEKMKTLDKDVDALAKILDPADFCKQLLDLTAGFYRVMDSFSDFPALKKALKLPESQLKILIKCVKASAKALTMMKPGDINTSELKQQMRRAICLTFRLAHEVFNQYWTGMDGKHIGVVQELLLSLGFKSCAKNLFLEWRRRKEQQQKEAAEQEEKKEEKDAKGKKKKDEKDKGKKGKEEKGKKKDKDKDKEEEPEDLDAYYVDKTKRQISFKVPKGFEFDYQLKHMGPDLERTTGSRPDPRVLFKPDNWQRTLLDVVDQEESALICAPTASGKTFICYYAMEKILRADNESRVVYVAPSKALVNQVSAEIYARFSSKVYPTTKMVMSGTFLKEFQVDGFNSQVVVMEPAALELVLFSQHDEQKRAWVDSLKYVIFDEIHCIGNLEGGSRWEHCLQLIPCPFLALSATVGNPHAFHAWLERVRKNQPGKLLRQQIKRGEPTSYKVHLITHEERYSDLYKYVYDNGQLIPLNPISCLNFQQVCREGLPVDLFLNPPESIELVSVLLDILPSEHVADVEWLLPATYFKYTRCITKRQYRYFLSALKKTFVKLVGEGKITEERFETITRRLQENMRAVQAKNIDFEDEFALANMKDVKSKTAASTMKSHSEAGSEDETDSEEESEEEKEAGMANGSSKAAASTQSLPATRPAAAAYDAASTTATAFTEPHKAADSKRTSRTYLDPKRLYDTCKRLEDLQYLPALIFNFSRSEIMVMLKKLVTFLEDGQRFKYLGTEERAYQTRLRNQQRQREYQRRVEEKLKNEKLKTLSKREIEEQGQEVDQQLAAAVLGPPPNPIEDEYDPEFAFANRKIYGSNKEAIDHQIDQKAGRSKIHEAFIEGLRRGVGVHHEGMPKKYRQVVEVLLRMGYLRVVIATGSLALGLNMPCRTVVFAGDFLELTPLMYRQMAGRAGRRGFDPLGHVLFWDMPMAKLRRLMTSPINVLTGDMPVSHTLVLRTLHLFYAMEGEDEEEVEAKRKALRTQLLKLFKTPLCTVADEDFSSAALDLKKTEDRVAAADQEAGRVEGLLAQIAYMCRFSVDALFREGLLDRDGEPCGLNSMVTFLYEDAPSNIVFHRLFLTKKIHKHLEGIEEEIDRDKALLVLLAHIFHRKFFTRAVSERIRLAKQKGNQPESSSAAAAAAADAVAAPDAAQTLSFTPFSSYSPLLPPLPSDLLSSLQSIDKHTKMNFQECVRAFSSSRRFQAEELTLPLSKEEPSKGKPNKGPLGEAMKAQRVPVTTRSPYAALAGKGDLFESADEIFCCSRRVVRTEPEMLPCFASNSDPRDVCLANSYILDFYTHGKIPGLTKDNLLAPLEAWQLVKGFSITLGNIVRCVDKMSKKLEKDAEPDIVVSSLRRLDAELKAKKVKEDA